MILDEVGWSHPGPPYLSKAVVESVCSYENGVVEAYSPSRSERMLAP